MAKIKGVIFDMDGLLFDTEKIYYQTQQAAADKMGFAFDEEVYKRFIGVSDEEVWQEYFQMYADHGREKIQEFIDESWGAAKEHFKTGEVDLKPGVKELLAELKQRNIPKVVASSNVREVIETLLDHAGIADDFIGIVSADDVQRAKPAPDIFQKALTLLELEPQEALVLEDSQNGIYAANAAEIPVIMVPDMLLPDTELRDKTVAVCDSLLEVGTKI